MNLHTNDAAGIFAWYSDVRHPAQVARDPFLSNEQKREFLADWASDRRAVVHDPTLRLSKTGALASIDDILAALGTLDDAQRRPTKSKTLRDALHRGHKRVIGELLRVKRRSRDDDDEPPPVPSMARPPVPRPDVDACGALLEAA